MKRFKTQQAFFVLIMLAVSFLLFTGCNSGSDEVALVTAQVDNVLPGACTAAGPQVIVSTPANATEGVAINTVITAKFDEVMDPTTIAYTDQSDPQVLTFTVWDNAHPDVNIKGTVAMDVTNTTATFKPTDPLTGDSWYTATISTYAKNAGGTALGCSYQWQFKTVAP